MFVNKKIIYCYGDIINIDIWILRTTYQLYTFFINSIHPTVKFTIELETKNKINLLYLPYNYSTHNILIL